MARWRVATWNLDWWGRFERRKSPWDLIKKAAADVFALQEVRGSEIDDVRSQHAGETLFSHEIYPRATLRWMGCGLLLAEGAQLLEKGVILDLPKPQRGLWARVDLPGQGPLTIVSWHAPNAAGDTRKVKMRAYEVMADWLADAEPPLVLGADLNTWIDPVELLKAEPSDPYFEESAFVGPEPSHGLVDGFRAALRHKGLLAPLRQKSPEGPLAVSHVLSDGASHRMDRIFVSSTLVPVDGDYWYDEAKWAGSDHALHWIDLEGSSGDSPARS